MNFAKYVFVTSLMFLLAACSPMISGTVQLVDAKMQPISVTKESPQGTVVNMINITTTLEKASQAVTTDALGNFGSVKDFIIPGTYKVEATRIGYLTETKSVLISDHTRAKLEFKLKKIPEGKRKSIEGSKSDEDKIVNPGEVNLQPPTM